MLSTGGLKPSGIEPLGLSGENRLVHIRLRAKPARASKRVPGKSKNHKERHTITGSAYRSQWRSACRVEAEKSARLDPDRQLCAPG